MNERINDLRLQAGISRLHDEPKFMVAVSEEGKIVDPLHGLEKFAALIVKECAEVLRTESERLYRLSAEEKDELFASNFEICAEKCVDNETAIKEHFGVEE